MDSPLLPTIRGGPRDLDDTFADMSLASARSPEPESSRQQSNQPHRRSVFGRPAPTRLFDDTPEAPLRTMNSDSRQGKAKPPRQSIFPALGSSSSQRIGTERSALVSSTSSRTTESNADKIDDDGDGDADVTIHATDEATAESRAKREERLKDSLYELRGINDTFETFLYALESARGHNERLACRVNETSELLNQYTALLGQAEHTQKLLSNPNWTGADDDVRAMEAEQAALEAAEMEAARKAEEAEIARREEEERAQRAAADAARSKEGPTRGGTRGRGLPPRGGATRGRGSGIPPPSTRTVSGGRPPSSTRQAPPGSGLGGQYANVKSSGYGPPRKGA